MRVALILTIVLLCFRMSSSIIVFVKDIDNAVSIFEVKDLKPESTIAELKKKIALIKGLPIWAFHVLFKDLLLKDLKKTIAACGIHEGGTITVIKKDTFSGFFFLAGKL